MFRDKLLGDRVCLARETLSHLPELISKATVSVAKLYESA